MTSGYILILAILVLGGLIATLGDRLGTKIGKARLSLFKLRPKRTAVVVTILTGIAISASTLGILFALSRPLREGVFQFDDIQRKLRQARRDLTQVSDQKKQIQTELAQSRAAQAEAQKRLDAINQSLNNAKAAQSRTQSQLNRTSSQLLSVATNARQAQEQLAEVSQRAGRLRGEIEKLQSERQDLIRQREQVRTQIDQLKAGISQRDREIAKRDEAIGELDSSIGERDRVIAQRETQLKDLEKQVTDREALIATREKQLADREKQLTFLAREVAALEQYYENFRVLREGNLALLRGQVLASGVLRIVQPNAARQAVDQLLREANRNVLQATLPGANNGNERVVLVTEAQVNQLISQIQNGQDYVVRILAAGNYLRGEKQVAVFTEAVPNKVIFEANEVVATASADPSTMTEAQLRERVDLLLSACQFRARRAGILGDSVQVGDGRITTLINFFEKVKGFDDSLELRAVTVGNTYTSGPLVIQLVAISAGQVAFST